MGASVIEPHYLCHLTTQRVCKTRQNPDSCFQCHFTLCNHKGFLTTCCQCPAENRSAHHRSYYSLSSATAWGYTIVPDRKRRRERDGARGGSRGGGRERKTAARHVEIRQGEKKGCDIRGRRAEDVKVTAEKLFISNPTVLIT